MRKTLLLALGLMVCVPLGAQTTQRDSALAQARYLKSIYRTDEAVEVLRSIHEQALKDPERMHHLPATTPVSRPDEVAAARSPRIRYDLDPVCD